MSRSSAVVDTTLGRSVDGRSTRIRNRTATPVQSTSAEDVAGGVSMHLNDINEDMEDQEVESFNALDRENFHSAASRSPTPDPYARTARSVESNIVNYPAVLTGFQFRREGQSLSALLPMQSAPSTRWLSSSSSASSIDAVIDTRGINTMPDAKAFPDPSRHNDRPPQDMSPASPIGLPFRSDQVSVVNRKSEGGVPRVFSATRRLVAVAGSAFGQQAEALDGTAAAVSSRRLFRPLPSADGLLGSSSPHNIQRTNRVRSPSSPVSPPVEKVAPHRGIRRPASAAFGDIIPTPSGSNLVVQTGLRSLVPAGVGIVSDATAVPRCVPAAMVEEAVLSGGVLAPKKARISKASLLEEVASLKQQVAIMGHRGGPPAAQLSSGPPPLAVPSHIGAAGKSAHNSGAHSSSADGRGAVRFPNEPCLAPERARSLSGARVTATDQIFPTDHPFIVGGGAVTDCRASVSSKRDVAVAGILRDSTVPPGPFLATPGTSTVPKRARGVDPLTLETENSTLRELLARLAPSSVPSIQRAVSSTPRAPPPSTTRPPLAAPASLLECFSPPAPKLPLLESFISDAKAAELKGEMISHVLVVTAVSELVVGNIIAVVVAHRIVSILRVLQIAPMVLLNLTPEDKSVIIHPRLSTVSLRWCFGFNSAGLDRMRSFVTGTTPPVPCVSSSTDSLLSFFTDADAESFGPMVEDGHDRPFLFPSSFAGSGVNPFAATSGIAATGAAQAPDKHHRFTAQVVGNVAQPGIFALSIDAAIARGQTFPSVYDSRAALSDSPHQLLSQLRVLDLVALATSVSTAVLDRFAPLSFEFGQLDAALAARQHRDAVVGATAPHLIFIVGAHAERHVAALHNVVTAAAQLVCFQPPVIVSLRSFVGRFELFLRGVPREETLLRHLSGICLERIDEAFRSVMAGVVKTVTAFCSGMSTCLWGADDSSPHQPGYMAAISGILQQQQLQRLAATLPAGGSFFGLAQPAVVQATPHLPKKVLPRAVLPAPAPPTPGRVATAFCCFFNTNMGCNPAEKRSKVACVPGVHRRPNSAAEKAQLADFVARMKQIPKFAAMKAT